MAVSCAGHNTPCFKILPVPAAGGFSFPKGLELALVPESVKIHLSGAGVLINRQLQLLTCYNPEPPRKREPQLRNFLDQTGLCACLWGQFLDY